LLGLSFSETVVLMMSSSTLLALKATKSNYSQQFTAPSHSFRTKQEHGCLNWRLKVHGELLFQPGDLSPQQK
jgi:hypothetical protein